MKKYLIACLLLLGFSMNILAQETIEVTGTVVDNNKEPLIGVSISIKDSPGLGTVTDIDGKYNIKVKTYQQLVFSYVGFEKQEVVVKDRIINITLTEAESSKLTEVVITGTGVQQKLTVTGAITNVDAETLKTNPTGNIANSLAGNVPVLSPCRPRESPVVLLNSGYAGCLLSGQTLRLLFWSTDSNAT